MKTWQSHLTVVFINNDVRANYFDNLDRFIDMNIYGFGIARAVVGKIVWSRVCDESREMTLEHMLGLEFVQMLELQ